MTRIYSTLSVAGTSTTAVEGAAGKMAKSTVNRTADRKAYDRPLAPASLPEHLQDLEQKGLLKRGKQPLSADFWDLPRPADPQAAVRLTVLRERETGR